MQRAMSEGIDGGQRFDRRGTAAMRRGTARKAPSMRPSRAALLLIALTATFVGGCRGRAERPAESPTPIPEPAAEATAPGRRITRLHPSEARIGMAFNPQPNGNSAIAVVGAGFVRGDQVHWGDRPLKTVFGNENNLTAEVPKDLLDRVGEVTISVRNPADQQSPELRAVFRLVSAEYR